MPLPKMPSKLATLLDMDAVPKPEPRASKAVKAAKAAEQASAQTDAPALTQIETRAEPAAKKAAAKKAAKVATPTAAKKVAKKAAKKAATKTATKAAARTAAKKAAKKASKVAAKTAAKVVDQQTTDVADTAAAKPTPAPLQAPAVARLPAQPRRRAVDKAALFVLDTNVLLHDPSCLFRFEEHDIFLPMTTLEELDHQKKGLSEVARNARQVSRWLNDLVSQVEDFGKGIALDALGHGNATGRLYFQTQAISSSLPSDFPLAKADNQILAVVNALTEAEPERDVVLVSKDINMRLKARTLNLNAEDYFNDQVLEDTDLLYTGVLKLDEDFWSEQLENIESWQQDGMTFYRLQGPGCDQFLINQFVHIDSATPLFAQVREVAGQTAVLATLRDYTHPKNHVWGITARNLEQNFALNLLLDPDCDFVTLLGQAGTGKTLLTLAAGLTQVLETRRYNEIIMTRVTVPVAEDIGFLPGTEEEKMQPWMGALEDNLEVLKMGPSDGEPTWGQTTAMEVIMNKIKVKSLNFMRGRTFLNKFVIVDEAQNLTPKQMKTLITRAGPGSKVVCLGNIAQIDTPYLTEGSSGLTYVVDRFKDWPHAGHVTLQRGERSRLADHAAEVL